jgi:flagellar protein FlgJ
MLAAAFEPARLATTTATTDAPTRASTGLALGATDGATATATAATDRSFEARARAAADKFEGFFIGQMLRQMRSGASAFTDEGSAARDPLNADLLSLADGLLADSLAGRHAFGIADAILRQLLPTAEQGAFIERSPA